MTQNGKFQVIDPNFGRERLNRTRRNNAVVKDLTHDEKERENKQTRRVRY